MKEKRALEVCGICGRGQEYQDIGRPYDRGYERIVTKKILTDPWLEFVCDDCFGGYDYIVAKRKLTKTIETSGQVTGAVVNTKLPIYGRRVA